MRVLFLKDTTIELSTRDDESLTNMSHLILEIASKGNVVSKANLTSRESSPGIWKANKIMLLEKIFEKVVISVSKETNENKRQLLGSMKVKGSELNNTIGKLYELPLICNGDCPSLVLKIQTLAVEDDQGLLSRIIQPKSVPRGTAAVLKMVNDSIDINEHFKRHGDLKTLDQAILRMEIAAEIVGDLLPGNLNNLAAAFFYRFIRLGNIIDLHNAVSHGQKAVDLTSNEDPTKPICLSNVGNSYRARFQQLGDLADLDNAILRGREAVDITPEGDLDKTLRLSNLAISLEERFTRFGSVVDIDEAISKVQMAVDLTPDSDPGKRIYLNNLGTSLETRFQSFGRLPDLNNAILQKQRALELAPEGHASKPAHLSNLGVSLGTRFRHIGNLEDLDRSILHTQMAVKLTPDNHPDMPGYLNNLGASLETRFQQLGNIEDLNDAIWHQQMAVNLTPDGRVSKPMLLTNLGMSLRTRFQHLGDPADHNDATSQEQLVANLILDDHIDKAIYQASLGASFYTRSSQFGNLEDLDRAISQYQMAVEGTQDDHPGKPSHLNNLGNSLGMRFERLGNLMDLDSAILQLQAAVDRTPENHIEKPAYLNNLGIAFETRFQRLRSLGDLDNAITQKQMAVKLTPDRHVSKPKYLCNLGVSLHTRFGLSGDIADLDDAIQGLKDAADLISDSHTQKSAYLNNLGTSYQTRFRHLGDPADLDNAIIQKQKAVDLTPDEHPSKSMHLSNLGVSLKNRFQLLGNNADLDDAISLTQMAVDLIPDNHPERSLYLLVLGKSIKSLFHLYSHPEDAESAIYYLSASASFSTGRPTTRFKAAQEWISIASQIGHRSLMTAYECALETLPLIAWLGLPIRDRHQHLIKLGAVARDAAATAISLEQYDKAIEWLEQGRLIVWTQSLQLRTPVDQLRELNQDLADRLLEVSQLLDPGPEQLTIVEASQLSMEEEGRRRRALTTEWESIIKQVRSLPGFENFLRPPRFQVLKEAAGGGPVVVINAAEKRCDALVILTGCERPTHIPLANITFQRIIELRDELKDALVSSGVRMRGERAAKKIPDETEKESCQQILAELWTELVKPILDSLGLSSQPNVLPRVWWCTTGPLSFLPIHAAGVYDSTSVDSQLSSYAISSYTPSLSALLEPPEPTVNSTFQLLSVIQSSAPGASSIPNTEKELEYIRNRLGNRQHVVLEGAAGTKGRVTKAMEECNWLHLACHGIQKPEDPTKSALILEDGHLTLEEITKLNLPKAEFAFLSACQTTTGDENLSEEAVHIAGGMLLTGYRGVVATMWSIRDELAPDVANGFYGHIMKDGERPDGRKAAEALHLSVQRLRSRPDVQLTDWIPFVHLGV